jgi:hypothetical protein
MSPELSRQIQTARTVSIFFMVYAHTSPGIAEANLSEIGIRGVDVVFFFFSSLVAKSAVPLLSILSGWLLVDALGSKRFSQILQGKARTLLAPMVFWNVLLLVLISFYAILTGEVWRLPQSAVSWINAVFSLTALPANIHLAFLRDLFVCAAAAPALLWLGRRWPLAVLAVLVFLAVADPLAPFILRAEILLFFTIGLLLRAKAVNVDWIMRSWVDVSAAFAISGFLLLYLQMQALSGNLVISELVMTSLVLTVRLCAAMFFWCIACALLNTALEPMISRAGEYVFIVFCSHVILFKALSLIGRDLLGGYYGEWFLPYFLIQPLLAFLVGWLIFKGCKMGAPALLPLILGRRGRRAQRPAMDLPLQRS